MKNHLLVAFLLLAACSPVFSKADVSRSGGEVTFQQTMSDDAAIGTCFAYGYMNHECGSVSAACADGADPRESLPTVSRLASGALRGVCIGDSEVETDDECEAKISAAAGAIGFGKGHCGFISDPGGATLDEWKLCEERTAQAGLCLQASVDQHLDGSGIPVGEIPHFFACLSFLDLKIERPLDEAKHLGREMLSMKAKTDADHSED